MRVCVCAWVCVCVCVSVKFCCKLGKDLGKNFTETFQLRNQACGEYCISQTQTKKSTDESVIVQGHLGFVFLIGKALSIVN
jgi:hypothetical protein